MNVINYIESKKIGLVINIPETENRSYRSKSDGYLLRQSAINNCIPLFTNIKNATFFISSLCYYLKNKDKMEIKSWQEYLLEM